MNLMKHRFKSVILVFLFLVSSVVQAEEEYINENNRTGDDVSNADRFNNSGCNPALAVTSNSCDTSNAYQCREIEDHGRKFEQSQQEAYKQYLLRRERQAIIADANIPDHVKARRQEYLQRMEQRRELFYRMMEQRRQDAAEKRAASQLRTHNFTKEADAEINASSV